MESMFSAMLRSARQKAGLTQKQLADALGVATGTVQQWELGTRFPRVEMQRRIEEVLNIALIPCDIDEEMRDFRRRSIIGAWKAAENKEGRKLSFDEAMSHYRVDIATQQRIENAINKLNMEGRRVAAERLEELTEIPKYTMPIIPKERNPKPSEGQTAPTDGK